MWVSSRLTILYRGVEKGQENPELPPGAAPVLW